MSRPLVSVLIASYNHEKFIKDTIESVLNQTYNNMEIIIVDDCSDDNSVSIIENFSDRRIKFFQNKINCGVVYTLNKLIELASGKYIAFIGSDDTWLLNKLDIQVKILEDNKNFAACFSRVNFIDEFNHIYTDKDNLPFCINDTFCFRDKSRFGMLRELYYEHNKLAHPTAIIRRDVVNNVGLFNNLYRQTHDYDYWLRVLLDYPIHVLDDQLINYRWRKSDDNSVSANLPDNRIRTANETMFIFIDFINKINKNIFAKVFNKESKLPIDDDVDLICQKFLVLLNCKILSCRCELPAIYFISRYYNDNRVVDRLANKYNFSISDLYKHNGNKLISYADCTCDNLVKFRLVSDERLNLIDALQNSLSWKITKPLRSVKKLLK